MEDWSTRGTYHDCPHGGIVDSCFGCDCPGSGPTSKQAKVPVDLKSLCLTNADNLQCHQRQRDRCSLGGNSIPSLMHRLPAFIAALSDIFGRREFLTLSILSPRSGRSSFIYLKTSRSYLRDGRSKAWAAEASSPSPW